MTDFNSLVRISIILRFIIAFFSFPIIYILMYRIFSFFILNKKIKKKDFLYEFAACVLCFVIILLCGLYISDHNLYVKISEDIKTVIDYIAAVVFSVSFPLMFLVQSDSSKFIDSDNIESSCIKCCAYMSWWLSSLIFMILTLSAFITK